MIEVIDNVIDVELQEQIKNQLMGSVGFPWHFIADITAGSKNNYETLNVDAPFQSRPGFTHINSEEDYHIISPIVHNVLSDAHIISAKFFLQLPLALDDYSVDTAHTDRPEPHTVVLYYVCDSDGDTIIYDKKWEPNMTGHDRHLSGEITKEWPIAEKVTPKQGRAIVFNGYHYHTAEQPRHNNRCIINFNVSYK